MQISNDLILENSITVNKSNFITPKSFASSYEPRNYGHLDMVRKGESILVINGEKIPVKKDQIFSYQRTPLILI